MLWLPAVNFTFITLMLLYISWKDIRARTITHRSLLFLLLSLLPLWLFLNWPINVMAAMIIFVFGFILFCLNIMGGGDVKLIALLALFIPEGMVASYLLLMSLLGGTIVLIGLVFFRHSMRENGVPYGVAISGSFILLIPFFTASDNLVGIIK